jgi:serine/threonine-protein kinase
MAPPQLTNAQVEGIIPRASDVHEHDRGGQKLVFTGMIDGVKYALKFMKPNSPQITGASNELLDDVTARAQREVETMQQCSTPHLVRMGPIGLQSAEVEGEPIIYFSEEFIEGKNLRQYLQVTGMFSVDELVRLAFSMSEAINTIWQFSKIHRDIKPSNIMRRDTNGDFVLLDMGLVFDLQDESLSIGPVGTPQYFSPEQMEFINRRAVMNFRSDLFSLGIVLYEMATGSHPFLTASSKTTWDVLGNIANLNPPPPISLRPDLPRRLNEVILRLLAKRPALRYRSIALFQMALREVEAEGGTA